MRLRINRQGKLVEQRKLLIMEKIEFPYIGGDWMVVKHHYFKEGETSVPLWPGQHCCWADEWKANE
jgi:hypothetical protein